MNLTARQKMQLAELTRDPIFLLQVACVLVTDQESVQYCDHCDGIFTMQHDCDDGDDPLTADELAYHDWGSRIWHTESVWYSRPEAEAYGKENAHKHADGWRVFCVPAAGNLAAILDDIDRIAHKFDPNCAEQDA